MIFAGAGGGGAPGAAPRAARGLLSCPSVIQMLPSRSTWAPCGKIIRPEPKLLTSVPDASNFKTGSSVEPRQVFAPHRSPTQIDLPSRSTSTALRDPHFRPSGILKKPAIVRYGFGKSLVGCCAESATAAATTRAARTGGSRTAPTVAIPSPGPASSPAPALCRRISAGGGPRRFPRCRCSPSSRARCCGRRRTARAAGRRRRSW